MIDTLLDLTQFAPNFLEIVPKIGEPRKFAFKKAQNFLHHKLEIQLKERGLVRALICKGRQLGCSTYVQGRYFHKVVTVRGSRAYILTHDGDATDNIFSMTRNYYEKLPAGLCPSADTSSAKKLTFNAFNSGYSVGTAGSKGTGRSKTITLFHGSEVAFWENAELHAKGALNAVSRSPGTEIILESTANGVGNYFHRMWMAAVAGESDFFPIFLPWYWDEEYISSAQNMHLTDEEDFLLNTYKNDGLTKENLAWRRIKISESTDKERGQELFQQEYPFNATESFINPVENQFIKAKYVLKARKELVETSVGLIIGVDPAGDTDGADRTTIIRRRGRCAYGLEIHRHKNTMEIAGLIARYIREENPAKVIIDSIGIGKGIVDRLREQGFSCVEGINVAETAHDKERFKNRRSELWCDLSEWLMQTMGVQIPDVDELQNDLCAPGYSYDSSGRLIIEGKKELKARGLPSTDCADALIHTFHGGYYETSNAETVQPYIIKESNGFFV